MQHLKISYKELLLVLIGWVLLGVIILLFGRGMFESLGVSTFVKLYCKNFSVFLLIVAINSLVLLPRLFYKNKKLLYFLLVLCMCSTVVFILKPFEGITKEVRKITRPEWDHWLQIRGRWHGKMDTIPVDEFQKNMPPLLMPDSTRGFPPPPMMMHDGPRHFPREDNPDLVSLLIFMFVIGGGFAIESSKRLSASEKSRLKAESEKTKAELSFLKAQINPHFLFNTLNNIYSMALVQRKETPDAVMRLSNIMRYVTETTDVEMIGLKEELHFISDYLFLNELKCGSKLDLIYEVKGDVDGKQLPPLLLISFIENAFKYGVSKRESFPIHIYITIEESRLQMVVENKIFKTNNTLKESTGMGIENTRKRLETIFPQKYQLDIQSTEERFVVQVAFPLSNNFVNED